MDKKLYGMDDEVMIVSSDSSDEENQALEQRAEEIERQLSNNLYLYDLHLELVTICEQTADLTSMRLAYQRFAKVYPLTSSIWMKWIKVEESLASTDDDKKRILDLFETATKDYLSIQLWLNYVQFAMNQGDLQQTHEILERALSTGGLHYTDAGLLWDLLREIELAHLGCISDKESEAHQKQLRRVVDAFKRQLSVPLLSLESTYSEWKEFLSQLPDSTNIDDKSIHNAYAQAAQKVDKFKPFEDRLLMSQTDDEVYEVYREYIRAIKDPSLAICLYERAIERLCLQPQVWVDYINFTLKLGDICLTVSKRALRNVTWSEELFCLRLKLLEKFEGEAEELMQCFEQGLSALPNTLNLWLDYIAYTRRNKATTLFKLLEQADLAQVDDPTFKIARYQAKLYAQASQVDKAREIWNGILLEASAKRTAQFWLEYINLERTHGTAPNARTLFNRALTCNTDWPQSIADEWLMFERECGTLDEVFRCTEKIHKILPEKLQHQADTMATLEQRNQQTPLSSRKRKLGGDTSGGWDEIQKRHKLEPKLPRNQGAPPDLDHSRAVFISNMSPTVTRQQVSKMFPKGKVTIATNNKGQSRCFGYVQFESGEEAQLALTRDREAFEGRPLFISKCKSDPQERQAAFKFAQHAEKNKLFVRGLPASASKEEVENIFKPFACTDVRLVLHKSGQSKGLAYIEFGNDADAERARQATDNTKVGEFVIAVAISAPPPKAKRDHQEHNQDQKPHARARLQVPLVPRAALKTQLNNKASTSSQNNVKPKSNNDFRQMLFQGQK